MVSCFLPIIGIHYPKLLMEYEQLYFMSRWVLGVIVLAPIVRIFLPGVVAQKKVGAQSTV